MRLQKWLNKIYTWFKYRKNPDVPAKKEINTEDSRPIITQDEEIQNGFAHKAEIVASLILKSINKSGVTFDGSIRDWPEGPKHGCHGEWHLYRLIGSQWIGGKLDHLRNNTTSRDWNNLNPENPYGIFKTIGVPNRGEIVAMMAVTYDHTKRTNAIFGRYP